MFFRREKSGDSRRTTEEVKTVKRIFSLKGMIILGVIALLGVATYFYGTIILDIVVNDIMNQ